MKMRFSKGAFSVLKRELTPAERLEKEFQEANELRLSNQRRRRALARASERRKRLAALNA